MASLVVLVFVLQLAIHVVNSIDASVLTEYIWKLLCLIPTSLSQTLKDSQKYKHQILQLKIETGKVSAQDDFAKWAKLQRQLDRVNADYEKAAAAISATKSKIKPTISGLRFVGSNGLRFIIPWWYTKVPMFWLPQGWVPYYIEWIVSFPRAPLGSVSIQTWAMACASIILLFVDALAALKTLFNSLKSTRSKQTPNASR